MNLTHTSFVTPLGQVCVAAHEQALCGVWFADAHRVPRWMLASTAAVAHTPETFCNAAQLLQEATLQINAYLVGQRRSFDLPLDLSWGTPFQQAVWRQLQCVAYAHTCTYADVAHAIGHPQAVRAVGTAIGRNPMSLLIPCHRVVGAQGQLSGYSGGLMRKQTLLMQEAR